MTLRCFGITPLVGVDLNWPSRAPPSAKPSQDSECCDRCGVTEPDGGLGAQASQGPGGIAGSAGAGLAGQPLFQVVRDAGGGAVPSPADRPVGVPEQARGGHCPGPQAVVGGLAAQPAACLQ